MAVIEIRLDVGSVEVKRSLTQKGNSMVHVARDVQEARGGGIGVGGGVGVTQCTFVCI